MSIEIIQKLLPKLAMSLLLLTSISSRLTFNANFEWIMVVGVSLTVLSVGACVYVLNKYGINIVPDSTTKNRYGKVLVFSTSLVSISVTLYFVIVYLFGGGYTYLFGHDEKIETKLGKAFLDKPRGCDYKLLGNRIDFAFFDFYCISQDFFDSIPVNRTFLIKGKKSIFGLYITGIELTDNKSFKRTARRAAA